MTKGKPSPRWAFWNRFIIPCQNGENYLARLRLIDTPWFGIYLHDIYHEDDGRDPHNHPYSFVSIVLRGSYAEHVYRYPERMPYGHYERRHKRFSIHHMDQHSAHRIVEAAPRLKTLILRGRRASGWGFFHHGTYIPWQEYRA